MDRNKTYCLGIVEGSKLGGKYLFNTLRSDMMYNVYGNLKKAAVLSTMNTVKRIHFAVEKYFGFNWLSDIELTRKKRKKLLAGRKLNITPHLLDGGI